MADGLSQPVQTRLLWYSPMRPAATGTRKARSKIIRVTGPSIMTIARPWTNERREAEDEQPHQSQSLASQAHAHAPFLPSISLDKGWAYSLRGREPDKDKKQTCRGVSDTHTTTITTTITTTPLPPSPLEVDRVIYVCQTILAFVYCSASHKSRPMLRLCGHGSLVDAPEALGSIQYPHLPTLPLPPCQPSALLLAAPSKFKNSAIRVRKWNG